MIVRVIANLLTNKQPYAGVRHGGGLRRPGRMRLAVTHSLSDDLFSKPDPGAAKPMSGGKSYHSTRRFDKSALSA